MVCESTPVSPKVKAQVALTATAADVAELLPALARAERDYARAVATRLGAAPTDLFALGELLSGEPMGVVELGSRIGVGSAGATSLVDRLEDAGHVTRGRHPHDRRRVVLTVTDRAREELLALLRALSQETAALAAELDQSERDAVARFLGDAIARYTAHTNALASDA